MDDHPGAQEQLPHAAYVGSAVHHRPGQEGAGGIAGGDCGDDPSRIDPRIARIIQRTIDGLSGYRVVTGQGATFRILGDFVAPSDSHNAATAIRAQADACALRHNDTITD